MNSSKSVRVHRFEASSPDDVSALEASARQGFLDPARIVAILGKTEGNGCVNDFTRGFASRALKDFLCRTTGRTAKDVTGQVALVMSGGTEGGLSPHWLVFEVLDAPAPPADAPATLAAGVSMTRAFRPEEVGRMAQVHATSQAVREAMRQAGIDSADDVHYVQVKCPLLTRERVKEARQRGHVVVTQDTYRSMGFSRGASALGVALALGEIQESQLDDQVVCERLDLFSSRASTSAGIELMENQIMVLGNSRRWNSELVIGHSVMQDGIDVSSAIHALASVGLCAGRDMSDEDRARIAAVLCKAEPSTSGRIRGRRHVMLDDSDIHASRHARALVGGALAGLFGDTQLFVSGGAEHQGPDGGGPVAVIARRS